MRLEVPDLANQAETLIAVVAGAVLATIGGFVATLLEARMHRRQRERTAALIFGEILASLRTLVRAVEDAHGRGEPFGPLTMRLVRGARREIEAYDRSRPALSDLRETDLRLSIHSLVTRITLSLDGIIESTSEIIYRDGSYDYLLSITPGLDVLILRLAPIAGQPITAYQELVQAAQGSPAAATTAAAQA